MILLYILDFIRRFRKPERELEQPMPLRSFVRNVRTQREAEKTDRNVRLLLDAINRI